MKRGSLLGRVFLAFCVTLACGGCSPGQGPGPAVIQWEEAVVGLDLSHSYAEMVVYAGPHVPEFVTCLYAPPSKRFLMVGTLNGLALLDDRGHFLRRVGAFAGTDEDFQEDPRGSNRAYLHSEMMSIVEVGDGRIWVKPAYGLLVFDQEGRLLKDYTSDKVAVEKEFTFIAGHSACWQFYPYDGSEVYLPYPVTKQVASYDGATWDTGKLPVRSNTDEHFVMQCGNRVLVQTANGVIDAKTLANVITAPPAVTFRAVRIDSSLCVIAADNGAGQEGRAWLVEESALTEIAPPIPHFEPQTTGLRQGSRIFIGDRYTGLVFEVEKDDTSYRFRRVQIPRGEGFTSFVVSGKEVWVTAGSGVWSVSTAAPQRLLLVQPQPVPAGDPRPYHPLVRCVLPWDQNRIFVGVWKGLIRWQPTSNGQQWLDIGSPDVTRGVDAREQDEP